MKFAASLATLLVSAAYAASAEGETQHVDVNDPYHSFDMSNYSGEVYYSNPGYMTPSYDHPYSEPLPGADFNSQVYHFDDTQHIWHQSDYEERVKVEAEMIVALEALKTYIHYIHHEIDEIMEHNAIAHHHIEDNAMHIADNAMHVREGLDSGLHRLEHLQEACYHTEMEIVDNRNALVLYCQQFAFAPEMVS